MSKMIIYFYLFIPLLFSSTDSSSIRDRTNKNELVPFLNSRVDPLKRDPNSLKIVSNEPFIIQLQMPSSREKDAKRAFEKDKKRKRPLKKRVSKIKPLKKKHRTRRELLTLKTKVPEQKLNQSEMPHAVKATEQLLNHTKNSINRTEILKALSSFSKKNGTKQRKFEEIKNVEKMKYNPPSRNHHNHDFSLSKQPPHIKMIYPSTPKLDQHQHKYTYKDLMADRERLEQKIKYIKNMLNVSDSASDDTVRVRRRSDSDRTANKIAKMFLTLSAVNGLHDRRKSKCREDYEEEDRMRDVWEKERKNNPTRKSSSSNEERYKVKKWIEYMKNKRSSSKTCPCMTNEYDEESDIFPLEQKLPKGYFLRDRGSEESSESYSDPFYYSRDKLNNNNSKNRFEKYQDQENKLKALAKNGKKKLELPFDDLEVYRSRAKQILQNAEEILDRIKEEEEKRLNSPNILMSQLKELTSRIQTDPRNNNENDLIRKIQKNLGWGALAKPDKETDDSTFRDNVKSFILDPYEKAKALTDESTKKLSSYLLRNLGKLQDSSEEQEEGDQETARENSQVYFEQIPQKEEEKSVSASLAKKDSTIKVPKNNEDTLLINLHSNDEVNNKSNQEEVFKQRAEEIIKEQQKKVSEYKENQDLEEISQEIDNFDQENEKVAKTEIETAEKSESEKHLESEEVAAALKAKKKNENDKEKAEKFINSDSTKETEIEETKNTEEVPTLKKIPDKSDFIEKKKKLETNETPQKEKDQSDVFTPGNVPIQEELKGEVKETMKTNDEEVRSNKLDIAEGSQEIINIDEREKKENGKYEDVTFPESEEQKLGQKRENEGEKQNHTEFEKADTSVNVQEISSKENTENQETANQKKREENVSSPQYLFHNYDDENSEKPFEADENLKDNTKAVLEKIFDETKSSKETTLQMQETVETESSEDSAKVTSNENNFVQDNVKELSDPSQHGEENVQSKESFNKVSDQRQGELPEGNEKQHLSDAETTQRSIQYEDLRKESLHEHEEFLKSNRAESTESSLKSDEQSKKEREEKTEKNEDQNLRMENPDNETSQSEDERENEGAKDRTGKEILENSENLEKKLNDNESKWASIEREDQENLNKDDLDTPLRATLDKNSNEDLTESEKSVQESRESLDEPSEDNNQLQSKKFENQEKKTTEKSTTDKTSWENRNQYENERDGVTLKAKKPTDEMSNESLDKSSNEDINAETSLKKKNENNEETESSEIPLRAAMKKQSDENDLNAEDVDEITLREKISKQDSDKEINEKLMHSNEDKSEVFLGSRMKEDRNLENSLEIINPSQNINDGNEDETKNTAEEIDDKIFSKNLQKNEENGERNPLKIEKAIYNTKSQEENRKHDSNKIILKMAKNEEEMEKLNETDSETMSMIDLKDREADRVNEVEEKEVTLNLGKPQLKNWNENQKDESFLNSQEQDTLKKEHTEEITLKEASLDKTSKENQSSKNSRENDDEESLKASSNEQSQENPKVNESQNEDSDQNQSRKSKEESSHETLKEVSVKESQENLNELSDEEALKAVKLSEEVEQNHNNAESDEATIKSTSKYSDQKSTEIMDEDEITKQTNPKESEQWQDNFSTETSAGKIVDKQDQSVEMSDNRTERKLSENKNNQDEENFEESDGESTFARMANPGEYENNKGMDQSNRNLSENDREDTSLESTVESQQQEKKEVGSDEIIQAENPEEDQDPLKTTSSENTLNDKTENEKILLKSEKGEEKKDAEDLVQDGKDDSEETVREKNISDALSNQIDQEKENENPLELTNFDQIRREESEKSSHEEGYETLGTERLSTENLSTEDDYEPQLKAAPQMNHDNSPDFQEEQDYSSASDFIQKTDSAKTDKLKVPKSIGNIMKALEGKEKDDITSFRNLNPDKIDHIIDKIDEAEQQSLRESLEDDCRKDCACAEEIGTKSRNMGRYEIVKDFLFWMKDLQLNRVLSDD